MLLIIFFKLSGINFLITLTDPKCLNAGVCSSTVTSTLVWVNVPCSVVKESAMHLISQYYCIFSIMVTIVIFSNTILSQSVSWDTWKQRQWWIKLTDCCFICFTDRSTWLNFMWRNNAIIFQRVLRTSQKHLPTSASGQHWSQDIYWVQY